MSDESSEDEASPDEDLVISIQDTEEGKTSQSRYQKQLQHWLIEYPLTFFFDKLVQSFFSSQEKNDLLVEVNNLPPTFFCSDNWYQFYESAKLAAFKIEAQYGLETTKWMLLFMEKITERLDCSLVFTFIFEVCMILFNFTVDLKYRFGATNQSCIFKEILNKLKKFFWSCRQSSATPNAYDSTQFNFILNIVQSSFYNSIGEHRKAELRLRPQDTSSIPISLSGLHWHQFGMAVEERNPKMAFEFYCSAFEDLMVFSTYCDDRIRYFFDVAYDLVRMYENYGPSRCEVQYYLLAAFGMLQKSQIDHICYYCRTLTDCCLAYIAFVLDFPEASELIKINENKDVAYGDLSDEINRSINVVCYLEDIGLVTSCEWTATYVNYAIGLFPHLVRYKKTHIAKIFIKRVVLSIKQNLRPPKSSSLLALLTIAMSYDLDESIDLARLATVHVNDTNYANSDDETLTYWVLVELFIFKIENTMGTRVFDKSSVIQLALDKLGKSTFSLWRFLSIFYYIIRYNALPINTQTSFQGMDKRLKSQIRIGMVATRFKKKLLPENHIVEMCGLVYKLLILCS